MHEFNNIGAYIKPVGGIYPQAGAAGTVTGTGTAIDRQGYESCVLAVSAGAATGSPTSFTINSKIQHSADGATNWTDLPTAAITAIAAGTSGARVNVDLSQALRYLQVVQVTAFVGGTSPAVPSHATVILGGAKDLPTS